LSNQAGGSDLAYCRTLEYIVTFDPMKAYIDTNVSCNDRLLLTEVSKTMFDCFASWRQLLLDKIKFWRKKQKRICLYSNNTKETDEYQRFFLFKTLYQMSGGIPAFERKLSVIQNKRRFFRNLDQSNIDLVREAWWKIQKKQAIKLRDKAVRIWCGNACFMDKKPHEDKWKAFFPMQQYIALGNKAQWSFSVEYKNKKSLVFFAFPKQYVLDDLLCCSQFKNGLGESVAVSIAWHAIKHVIAHWKNHSNAFLEYIFVHSLNQEKRKPLTEQKLTKMLDIISRNFPRTALVFARELFNEIPQSIHIFRNYPDFFFIYSPRKHLLPLPLYEVHQELLGISNSSLNFTKLTQKRNLYFQFFLGCVDQVYITRINQFFLYLVLHNFITKKELEVCATKVFLNKNISKSRVLFLLYYFFKDADSFSRWFKTLYNNDFNDTLEEKRQQYLSLLFLEHKDKTTNLVYGFNQRIALHNFLLKHHGDLFSPDLTLPFLIHQFLSYFFRVHSNNVRPKMLSELLESDHLKMLLQDISQLLTLYRDKNMIDYQKLVSDRDLFFFSGYSVSFLNEGGEALYKFMCQNKEMNETFFYLYAQCQAAIRKQLECLAFPSHSSIWAVFAVLKKAHDRLKQS
jgi:hypothetical protein